MVIAALTFCAATPAAADPPAKPPQIEQAPSSLADSATLSHDSKIVRELIAAVSTGGFDIVATHRAELEGMLAHAPTPFSQTEEHDGIVYLRAVSPEECVAIMVFVVAAQHGKHRAVTCVDNPYPTAALLLGSFLDEVHRPVEGLAMLDRGLGFDPRYPILVTEKGASLNMMHRSAEALAVYKSGLADIPDLDTWQRGQMLRGEGYALVELNRLDEAEAAYKESLKVDPNHGFALKELQFINSVRAGAPTYSEPKFVNGVPVATPPK
jgi:hypothetical protein